MARNPFICDCHLRWLNAYLREKQIETSGVRCAGPRRMAKRKFGVLNDRRFRCRSLFNHPLKQNFTFSIQIEWNTNKQHIALNAVYNVRKDVHAMEQLLSVVDYNYTKYQVIFHHLRPFCKDEMMRMMF